MSILGESIILNTNSMINHFEESEIPYGTLERFGLTQEMIEDLPVDVLQNIYNGRRSPVLPISIITEDGETETARTRFSLERTPEGGVDVLFYPKLDDYDLNLFNEQQKQRLLEGKAIIGYLESNEENKEAGGKRFFQIDPESKQVLCVPMPVIGRNMQYVADRYHLTGAEMQKLQNGDALSILNDDDEEITMGIDLNSKTGIRFVAGDEQTWKREAKREWDKYNFGAFGCWVAEDGDLDYVHEEDYSEEMWQEQKKVGMRFQR